MNPRDIQFMAPSEKNTVTKTRRPEDYPDYNPKESLGWGCFCVIGITVISAVLSLRDNNAGLWPWNFSVFFNIHILHNSTYGLA